MRPLDLLSVDFDEFSNLLQRHCPWIEELALVNSGDVCLATHDHIRSVAIRESDLARRDDRGNEWIEIRQLEDGPPRIVASLTTASGAFLATLIGYISEEANADHQELEHRTMQDFAPLAQRLLKEARLTAELDDMAGELIDRYDELNLVYNTADEAVAWNEGQTILKKLLENCCQLLGAGIAVLQFPEKRLVLTSEFDDSVFDVDDLRDHCLDDFFEVMKADPNPIVANLAAEQTAVDPSLLRHRILVSPVLDAGGKLDGALYLLRNRDQAAFTNSDKNLTGVMARKASKILQSHYDQLTGQLNRKSFEQVLTHKIDEIRSSQTRHCLLSFNIDRLQIVYDTLGYEVGDLIIVRIVEKIRRNIRDTDTLARTDTDEFGICLDSCGIKEGKRIAEKLRLQVEGMTFDDVVPDLKMTIRLGITPLSDEMHNAAAAIAASHLACEEAARQGGNRCHVYTDYDQSLRDRRQFMQMVPVIQGAIRNDRFQLFSQLIAPLAASGEKHLELLLRLTGDDGELISPATFLPAAERYQLMPEVDRWVIERAFSLIAQNADAGNLDGCIFSINLSGQSLSNEHFDKFLIDRIRSYGIPTDLLCFEITETAAVANLAQAKSFMARLKRAGCRLSLDDFGSGLSSFGYLKTFPVDYLKIDGSLVRDIGADKVAETMVSAICQIAGVMGLQTIAEHVETNEVMDRLGSMGIDHVQGFAIERPRPLTEFFAELSEPAKMLAT